MTEQVHSFAHCDFCYGAVLCRKEHNRHTLLYFPYAGNELQIGAEQRFVPSGALFLFDPKESWSLAQISAPFYSLSFSPQMLVEESREALDALCDPFFSCEGISASAIKCLLRFEELACVEEKQKPALIKLLLSELILHISAAKEEVAHEPKLGLRVKRYIDTHLTASLSLEELARQFFVSKFYLCRVFKTQCKLPVGQYIRQKRIELAASMMQSGETASSAAFCAGFGDYSTFYRAHKKISGKSPMENA